MTASWLLVIEADWFPISPKRVSIQTLLLKNSSAPLPHQLLPFPTFILYELWQTRCSQDAASINHSISATSLF